MINAISGLGNAEQGGELEDVAAVLMQRANQAKTLSDRAKVKDEFLALFYKALLKKTFKPESFGFGESANSFSTTYATDLLVEKLARDLAKKQSFDLIGEEIVDKNAK
ncbi:MAG: hypothetical protein ABIH69_00840 [bacterium]